ncbi:signal recognition particle SPR68 [Cryptosporidium canis]|uniref:Signal recognition particle subunit SRP68 n=1 Tax=Cryptosporidium canis TaxID=195482 RepID=A0ABQ8P2L4_9CRYT|nr:signal recognition particle SPR68 [Cryptosporidium canis]KAJ1612286.1 signal recognition particle SPR68 [Cryptosporidium canis]
MDTAMVSINKIDVQNESNDELTNTVNNSDSIEVSKIELPLLVIAKYLQYQNGLKHKDFAQYTRYCSRKLHRLRSGLKMKCGRSKFQKSFLEPSEYTSHKHMLVLILLIERSWSAGTEIGSRLSNNTDMKLNSSSRGKFHQIRKLRRGCKLSNLLIEVARNRCTNRSIVEVQAYQSYILGNYYLKSSNWEKGALELNKSLKLYQQLKLDVSIFETSSVFSHFNISKLSKTECIKIYDDRIAEMAPLIRLCQYHCKRLNIFVPDFDHGVTDIKTTDTPVNSSNVRFSHNNKEYCVPISSLEILLVELQESYKTVKGSINLEDTEKLLKLSSNMVIECYSETLMCSSTLKNKIHEEMARISVSNETPLKSNTQSNDLIVFESYTRNFNLFVSIERDLIFIYQLIEYFNKSEFYTKLIFQDDEAWKNMSQELQNISTKKLNTIRSPDEGVRICDIINFTISEIASNNKTEFIQSLTEMLSMVIANCRSLFLSHCFGQMRKIQEAFVLCDLVKSRLEIETNLDELFLDRDGIFQRIITLIKGICLIVNEVASKSYNIYLSNVTVQKSPQSKTLFVKGIHDILDEETLNPKILPIPVKPIMFDIASDFISPPDLSNKIKKNGLANIFSKATSKLGLFKK